MRISDSTIRALAQLRDSESGDAGAFACRFASVAAPVTPRDDGRLLVPVRWTVGADVVRQPWFGGEPFIERLLTGAENVNLSRLNNEAPYLDCHRSWDLSNVLGKVVANTARMQDGSGLADVEFDPEDERSREVYSKIVRGFLPKVSVGYRIDDYEILRGAKDEMDIVRVTLWTPSEISSVPMGADDAAGFRFHAPGLAREDRDGHKRFFFQGARNMRGVGRGGSVVSMLRNAEGSQGAGGAPPVAANPPAAPTPPAASEAEIRAAERVRVRAIEKDGARLGLPPDFVRTIADGSLPIDAARSAMFAEAERIDLKTPTSGAAGSRVMEDESIKTARAWGRAMLVASDPTKNQHDEASREWAGCGLLDFARHALERAGRDTRRMDRLSIAKSAIRLLTPDGMERFEMRGGAALTTTDFPLILADVMNKSLMAGWNETPQTFPQWARREDLPDLRNKHLINMSAGPDLRPVNEHGEFEYGTLTESEVTYKLGRAARGISITPEILLNDNLGAFTQLPNAFGAAASRYESNIFYAVFKANPAVEDGIAMFHVASHANRITDGAAAPSVDSISATRLLMAKQVGMASEPLSITPDFILVPPELTTKVEQLISGMVVPTAPTGVVPSSMRSLVPIEEPRLSIGTNASLTAWYLLARWNKARTMVYGRLQGRGDGPTVEMERNFETGGIKWKAEHYFTAAGEGYRGAVRNDGA